MKVRDAMSSSVEIASPEDTIAEVGKMMGEIDAGAIPVGEDDRLIGMITDRDIAIRAVACGKGPDTPVREVMTNDLQFCFEDDDASKACVQMADQQVRRLPVLSRDKRLVGIVSLSDLAGRGDGAEFAGLTLREISRPGGAHTRSASAR